MSLKDEMKLKETMRLLERGKRLGGESQGS